MDNGWGEHTLHIILGVGDIFGAIQPVWEVFLANRMKREVTI